MSQIMGDISTGIMTIYANDDSKCDDNDDPTIASILSRIYRLSQAFTCILCQYDPTLSNMLLAGTYPQVLMGKQTSSGYPGWVTPDSTPTENSSNLVTSGGIYTAIQNAILSVWHMWDKGDDGSFAYFVTAVGDLPTSGLTSGDYAIVYTESSGTNAIYQWNGSSWVLQETITQANMENFAVINIENGDYAGEGLYWFESGWNLLNASLKELEDRLTALETAVDSSVQAIDSDSVYKIGVRSTYALADAVTSETGVTKIVFISGSS